MFLKLAFQIPVLLYLSFVPAGTIRFLLPLEKKKEEGSVVGGVEAFITNLVNFLQ